jgi:hypothetical protein
VKQRANPSDSGAACKGKDGKDGKDGKKALKWPALWG